MKPTTARVLRTLQDAGHRGATTAELCQADVGGVRFAARLHELRHEHGFEIDEMRVRQGSSRYTLAVGEPSPATHPGREPDEGEPQRRPPGVASSGSSVPRRVAALAPYRTPPDTEHEWVLVWDYDRASANCGRSFWERPSLGEQLGLTT